MPIIAFSSAIGPVPIDCILSEKHTAEVEITGNPIEIGAEVNDNAYVKPKQVVLEIADSSAALVYNVLLRFQETRVPFYLVTGLTVYKDMLIQAIDATRDKDMSRVLRATVTCRQVIIVSTASVPASQGSKPTSSPGQPGGANSRNASSPTSGSANNPSTANRTAQPVQRGDSPSSAVPSGKSQSLAKRIFG